MPVLHSVNGRRESLHYVYGGAPEPPTPQRSVVLLLEQGEMIRTLILHFNTMKFQQNNVFVEKRKLFKGFEKIPERLGEDEQGDIAERGVSHILRPGFMYGQKIN